MRFLILELQIKLIYPVFSIEDLIKSMYRAATDYYSCIMHDQR